MKDAITQHSDIFPGLERKQVLEKFTAIYTESWMTGSHLQTITKMKRIEQQENETIDQMLEREDVADNLMFLFHGHSLQQGE